MFKSPSRQLEQHEREVMIDYHQKKLQEIQSSKPLIDQKPPPVYKHLGGRYVPNHLQEFDLKHSNQAIIEKLTSIMKQSSLENLNPTLANFPKTTGTQGSTMYGNQRINRVVQIQHENQKLLQRLQKIKSVFDIQRWEDDRKQTEKYVAMHCELAKQLITPESVHQQRNQEFSMQASQFRSRSSEGLYYLENHCGGSYQILLTRIQIDEENRKIQLLQKPIAKVFQFGTKDSSMEYYKPVNKSNEDENQLKSDLTENNQELEDDEVIAEMKSEQQHQNNENEMIDQGEQEDGGQELVQKKVDQSTKGEPINAKIQQNQRKNTQDIVQNQQENTDTSLEQQKEGPLENNRENIKKENGDKIQIVQERYEVQSQKTSLPSLKKAIVPAIIKPQQPQEKQNKQIKQNLSQIKISSDKKQIVPEVQQNNGTVKPIVNNPNNKSIKKSEDTQNKTASQIEENQEEPEDYNDEWDQGNYQQEQETIKKEDKIDKNGQKNEQAVVNTQDNQMEENIGEEEPDYEIQDEQADKKPKNDQSELKQAQQSTGEIQQATTVETQQPEVNQEVIDQGGFEQEEIEQKQISNTEKTDNDNNKSSLPEKNQVLDQSTQEVESQDPSPPPPPPPPNESENKFDSNEINEENPQKPEEKNTTDLSEIQSNVVEPKTNQQQQLQQHQDGQITKELDKKNQKQRLDQDQDEVEYGNGFQEEDIEDNNQKTPVQTQPNNQIKSEVSKAPSNQIQPNSETQANNAQRDSIELKNTNKTATQSLETSNKGEQSGNISPTKIQQTQFIDNKSPVNPPPKPPIQKPVVQEEIEDQYSGEFDDN